MGVVVRTTGATMAEGATTANESIGLAWKEKKHKEKKHKEKKHKDKKEKKKGKKKEAKKDKHKKRKDPIQLSKFMASDDDSDSGVERSVISGKRIKRKVDKTAQDHANDANRAQLLAFLNETR